ARGTQPFAPTRVVRIGLRRDAGHVSGLGRVIAHDAGVTRGCAVIVVAQKAGIALLLNRLARPATRGVNPNRHPAEQHVTVILIALPVLRFVAVVEFPLLLLLVIVADRLRLTGRLATAAAGVEKLDFGFVEPQFGVDAVALVFVIRRVRSPAAARSPA